MPDEEIEGQGSQVVEETQEVQPEETGQGSTEVNPLWNDMLGILPPTLHSQITPHLQKWDQNYTQGIQKVHSEYSDYKPYRDANIGAEQINTALQLWQAVQNDPQRIIDGLTQYMKSQNPQETAPVANTPEPETESDIPDEIYQHPKFIEMQNALAAVQQRFAQQDQQAVQEKQDEELENTIEAMKAEYGDFDVRRTLQIAIANGDGDLGKAYKEMKEWEQSVITAHQRPEAPRLMGPGGAAPDNRLSNKDMADEKTRKAYITNLLASRANQ